MIMWTLLLACRNDPPQSDVPTLVTDSQPGDTGTTVVGTGATGTGTGDTGATASTGETGTPFDSALKLTAVLTVDAHHVDIEVSGRNGQDLVVSCVAPLELEEDHQLTATTSSVRLRGLLAQTEHHCTLTAGPQQLDEVFTTLPSPITPSWDLIESEPSRMSGHYTLFNHGLWGEIRDQPHELIIVDPQGRVRWVKVMSLPAPDVDVTLLADGNLLYAGGKVFAPTIETLDGEVLWQAPKAATYYHHHAEELPSGEILTLTKTNDINPEDPTNDWVGFQIERFDRQGNRTWEWNSQRGVDEGWLTRNAQGDDPWHANALMYRDGITYVNLRQKKWLVALNEDGSMRWRMGPTEGSDVALVTAKGVPDDPANWFYGDHAPELHDDGRILMYDNGYGRPGGGSSRALELQFDEVAMEVQVTWEWSDDWYEPIWGDIDELPGGNVLLTKGHCDGCNADQRSEQLEVERSSGDVVWRIRHREIDDAAYRAQRIDGCDLFDNERYCP